MGIDLFLADAGRLNQGLGTEMVRQFVARLFEDPRVTRVQTDPSPDNPRAIRCYEKAGFSRRAGTGHHSQSAGPPHDHRPRVTAVPVQRRPGPPRVVVEGIEGRDTLYEVDLWAAPSPQWRAAFLRPPPALITAGRRPEVGRVAIHGATLHFRAAPRHLHAWLRRIDRWIAYANSVVEE